MPTHGNSSGNSQALLSLYRLRRVNGPGTGKRRRQLLAGQRRQRSRMYSSTPSARRAGSYRSRHRCFTRTPPRGKVSVKRVRILRLYERYRPADEAAATAPGRCRERPHTRRAVVRADPTASWQCPRRSTRPSTQSTATPHGAETAHRNTGPTCLPPITVLAEWQLPGSVRRAKQALDHASTVFGSVFSRPDLLEASVRIRHAAREE